MENTIGSGQPINNSVVMGIKRDVPANKGGEIKDSMVKSDDSDNQVGKDMKNLAEAAKAAKSEKSDDPSLIGSLARMGLAAAYGVAMVAVLGLSMLAGIGHMLLGGGGEGGK